MNRNRIFRIVVIFCILSFIGLLLSVQAHMLSKDEKEPLNWTDAIISNLGWIYLWGIASPLVLKLGSRYPLTRKRLVRNIAIHSSAAAILTLVLILILSTILWTVSMLPKHKAISEIFSLMWERLGNGDFIVGLLVYCIVLGIGQLLDFYRKYRERKLKATQLEARLAEAELETLKMQLHPSYLFNTLRSIARLIHEDLDAADRMIARLGDFLRLTLDTAGAREVTLQQEIDYLKCYLEIERIRLRNRLNIDLETQADTLDWLVPALILQPIVESVFQYSRVTDESLQSLLVQTWIADQEKSHPQSLAIRLKGKSYTEDEWSENQELLNARQRLQQTYGTAYRLDLLRDRAGNLEVLLRIPLPTNALEKSA